MVRPLRSTRFMKKLGCLLFVGLCVSGCAVTDELSSDADADADDENPEEVVAGSEAALTGSSLRVMSYNIKYGAECGLDLSKLAAVIKESNPDIIGLQEVDEGTQRSGNKKETDDLARLTGMQHRYFGANFDYDGGKYGLAILSKYPLINPRVVRLDNRTKRENGYEPRIAVTADINAPGGKRITFVTVHASLHDEEHEGNAAAILNNAIGQSNKSRALVVGDFNEKPKETIGDRLTGAGLVDAFHEKHRFFGYTAPANFPIRRIDFIYRGSALGKTAHAWVPNTKASDHRPVAAVIPL
jgi:endonuclease/exonuclease/phosphatase family metal-dependent hydrolase